MEQSMKIAQQYQEGEGSETVDDKTVKDKATGEKLTKQHRCDPASFNPSSSMYKKLYLI